MVFFLKYSPILLKLNQKNSFAPHNGLLHLLSVSPWSSHTAHELSVNPQIPSAPVCSWGENYTKSEKIKLE